MGLFCVCFRFRSFLIVVKSSNFLQKELVLNSLFEPSCNYANCTTSAQGCKLQKIDRAYSMQTDCIVPYWCSNENSMSSPHYVESHILLK